MGDKNPVRTLGDYSKPSHEGYKNTIELTELRSDTIRLVRNGCSFPGLRSEDPNQHLKDFLKLVNSLNLNGSISTWEDLTTCFLARFFPPKRTAKLRNDIIMFQQHQGDSLSEAWTRFKDLLQKYEDEGWYDPIIPEEGNIDYENTNIEQLLEVMKYKVDILMKDAISLMGRSESVFEMTSNEMKKESQATRRIYGSNYGRFHATLFGSHKEVNGKDKRGWEQDEKDRKITSYPETKVSEPLNDHKFSETLTKEVIFDKKKLGSS
nr:hypothetical protein [Tanacetum cinerariifolium]